jgi:hypothetical protein
VGLILVDFVFVGAEQLLARILRPATAMQ